MHFYLIDDDEAVRLMLTEIIEDENLGKWSARPRTERSLTVIC